MKFYISDSVLKETTKCTKEFSCLSERRKDLCKIVSNIDNNVHFIVCMNEEKCSYQQKIFERTYCNCPTRKIIYKSYRK